MIFALIFLILPLVFLNLRGLKDLKNKFETILYFASLGLGFMLIEVVLIQKFQLIVGHPVYTFSTVLTGLLVSSGIGSLLSERFKKPKQIILVGLAGIVVTTFVSLAFVKVLGPFVIGLPFAVRVILSFLLIAMNGLFMGVMMPSGIRLIAHKELAIPWMWSVNGVFSVVAGFLAIYLSLLFGFSTVLLTGLGVYALGALVFVARQGN